MIVTVAALRTELLFAPRPRLCVGVGAKARDNLRRWLASHRPTGAVVVGFSGAARAEVRAGTVVLASAIASPGQPPLELDPALVAQARETLPEAAVGPVATVAGKTGPADKARLGLDALAVDMESAGLAREFREQGIPFLVVRVILDALWEDAFAPLPVRWARRAMVGSHRLGRAARAVRPVLEGR